MSAVAVTPAGRAGGGDNVDGDALSPSTTSPCLPHHQRHRLPAHGRRRAPSAESLTVKRETRRSRR